MPVTSSPEAPRQRFVKVVASLLSMNLVVTGLTLISAPLQARALGPTGRGELAAIVVPLGLIPLLLGLGLPSFVMREAARERTPTGALLGSMGVLLAAIGAVCALLAAPLSAFIADGRPTVRVFLLIGLAMMPLTLVLGLLESVRWGQQRWRPFMVSRLIPAVGGTLGVVIMYATGTLTVASAAALVMILGLLAAVPLLGVVRSARPLVVRRQIFGEGLTFGVKAWAGRLTNLANQRLDQLVMVKFVSSRELGYYVMAVTIAGLTNIVAAASIGAMSPRIASGDHAFAARATRVTLATITLVSIALVALVPFLVPLLFGPAFRPVIPMAQILLASSIPLAGTGILAESLAAAGHPGIASRGELIAAIFTVGGLFLLLPPLGGRGAAIVSLVAYGVSFVYIVRKTAKLLPGTTIDYLAPTASDVRWLEALVARRRASRT
jgi:O-antigen/teichoic acid export membrane protein